LASAQFTFKLTRDSQFYYKTMPTISCQLKATW
jgi:hypothetical protein